MWIEWTIATKFLREGKAQSTLIFVGISVGVAVIVFLIALITGLQSNIIDRTLGTQAHIKIQPPQERNLILAPDKASTHLVLESKRAQRLRSINNWQEVRDALDTTPQIKAVSPVIAGPAFVRRGEAAQSITLNGIDAMRYSRIIPIQNVIVAGVYRTGAGNALIGTQLANDLGLRLGDKLRIDGGQNRESIVSVAGIFEFGVRELDSRHVYVDMRQAQSLLNLPGAATTIDVTVDDIFAAQTVAAGIARRTGLKAESWMETNAQLMNALRSQSLSTQMISTFVALSVALGIAMRAIGERGPAHARDWHPARNGCQAATNAAGVPHPGRAVGPGGLAAGRHRRLWLGGDVQYVWSHIVLYPSQSMVAGGCNGTGNHHRYFFSSLAGSKSRRA